MPDDLNIKLVLDAVNNMGGKVDQAAQQIDKVTKAVDQLHQQERKPNVAMTGSLLNPNTWSALMKDAEAFDRRMGQMQQSGLNKMMVGGAILAPVIGAVKAAGDLEEVMNQIKVDTFDSSISTEEWGKRVSSLRDTTVQLSREVKYSSRDIGEAVDSLVRGNVEVQEVVNGAGRAAVYLAQASKGAISTGQAAESVAKVGNAWQQSGKQMEQTADMLSRVDAASTASIPDLIEGFKYVSSTASNLKLDVREVAVSLGVLNNAGIDASTAGTTLNQLLQHLQPTTKAARATFEDLGLSVEKNPFFDANGRLKPMVDIIKILRNATKDMTDQQKQLAFKEVFDERGSRAVINLLKEGKNSYEDVNGSLDRQMSLWDRIKTQNQGMNSQVEILKSNITTLFAESGSPLGGEMTDLVKKANEATVSFTEWSKANPELVSNLLKLAGGVGGLTLALGAAQVALAGVYRAFLPIVAIVGLPEMAWLAGVGGTAYGLNKAAPYLPGTDAYADRKVNEQYDLYTKAPAELRKIPTTIGPAPDFKPAWYQRMDFKLGGNLTPDKPFSGTIPGYAPPPADQRQVNINIYPRDAQETAREVGRVINQPTTSKYVNSRHPVAVED